MLARIAEHLAHNTRGLANVLVDDRARDDLEEVRVDRRGDRAREEGLAGSWGSVEEDTLWWLDADAEEEFGVEEGKLNDLERCQDMESARKKYA